MSTLKEKIARAVLKSVKVVGIAQAIAMAPTVIPAITEEPNSTATVQAQWAPGSNWFVYYYGPYNWSCFQGGVGYCPL